MKIKKKKAEISRKKEAEIWKLKLALTIRLYTRGPLKGLVNHFSR